MANYKKWSNAERSFIRENSEIMSDRDIAMRMSKLSGEVITSSMIRQQRRKINAIKCHGRPPKKQHTDINIENG